MVFLFRRHVFPPCWEANTLHRLRQNTKELLKDFIPKLLISSANDFDFLLPCMKNKYVVKVIQEDVITEKEIM